MKATIIGSFLQYTIVPDIDKKLNIYRGNDHEIEISQSIQG